MTDDSLILFSGTELTECSHIGHEYFSERKFLMKQNPVMLGCSQT